MTNTNIYLPFVAKYNNPRIVFGNLLLSHPLQQRKTLQYSTCLQQSADVKARLLLETGIISHTINGIAPNALARSYCSNLATEYEDNKNYIESLVVGAKEADTAFNSLMNSPKHKEHLMGESDFYKEQQWYAVGYYEYANNYAYVVHIAKLV